MPPKRSSRGPTVVLVGRPNVGKSTLFNRITDSRRAIVTAIAGTTRDVIAQPAEWQGVAFTLVDTGGMFGASEDPLHELVVIAGRRALETADIVVFVVDGREGLVPGDQEIATRLRSVKVPVLMAVNKTDDKRARGRAVEFYQLGFEPVVEIAAEHGEGVGDLLDEIIERLPVKRGTGEVEEPEEIAVAIVGRPNVGKSSLLNRLLKEERSIVSDDAGDDPGHRGCGAEVAPADLPDRRYRGNPAAGAGRAQRAARVAQRHPGAAGDREGGRRGAASSIPTEGATDQDATIAGEAEKAGCGVIIAANKWDLMKGRGTDFSKAFDDKLRQQMKFLEYAPILHISAMTGERTPKVLETIDKVAEARSKRIPTGELNRFVQTVTAAHPPASPGRRQVRILYAAQKGTAPPTFVLFTNVATEFHFSYERFLVNRLRETFDLVGTPIRLQVRRRER